MNILLTVLLFPSVLLMAQSRWLWQNPTISGYGANDVCFINPTTGWIVGFDGLIMKTTDGGATFAPVQSNTNASLFGVEFVDERTGYIVGAGGLVYKTTDGGTTWKKKPNAIDVYFSETYFFNADTGWVCGYNGTLARTTDGGETWITVSAGVTHKFMCIHFFDRNTGIVGGMNNSLFKTTDAGKTWFSIAPAGNNWFSSVYMASADTIFAGTQGYIMRSVDGGAHWTTQSAPIMNVASFKFYSNARNGIAVGSGSVPYVLKTTDGGEKWETIFAGTGTLGQFSRASFVGTSHIFCTGKMQAMGITTVTTTNAGKTWNDHSSKLYFHGTGNRIHFRNSMNGFVLGEYNGVQRTTDGGETWSFCGISMNAYWAAIKLYDDSIGIAVGKKYGIARTTDGGKTWKNIYLDYSTDWLYDVELPVYPLGYAFGTGMIRKTTDAGLTWTNLPVPTGKKYGAGCFLNADTGWTCGPGFIMKTMDGGTHWETLVSSGGTFCDIKFLTSDTGWTCSTGGIIAWTVDGGVSWNPVQVDTVPILELAMTSTKTGYACGMDGFLAYTNDGGKHWHKQYAGVAGNDILSLSATDSATCWITGYGGFVKKTIGGVTIVSAVEARTMKRNPELASLNQNYPNPFNPSTTITFAIPARSFVSLKIFDVMGREIETLAAEEMDAGAHSRVWNAAGRPSGVYFYRLHAGACGATRRLVVIK